MGSRKVDVVTARAVSRAMKPGFDANDVAAELIEVAGGSWPLLTAALLRVDRALAERWSRVAADASDSLRIAVEMIDHEQRHAA